jgi:DNA repair protein RadC
MRLHVTEGRSVYLNRRTGPIREPTAIADVVREAVGNDQREFFMVFLLNTRHVTKRIQVISVGSLSASIVHPREVFRFAIRNAAASIILSHNHPSSDPTPSEDDIEITQRLSKVGETVGIEVLDHIIVGGRRFFSFREAGIL